MGLYYQPEGYFGPVCDVPMTAQDTYVPPTVEAPPPPEDCIVPYFCDHDDFDDGSADPPRYFCKKDENGDYYGCYVLGPTTPTTLGDPYTRFLDPKEFNEMKIDANLSTHTLSFSYFLTFH